MKTTLSRTIAILAAACLVGVSIFNGCASPRKPPGTRQDPTALSPGARLWADNCIRCHNLRPPESLTDSQWEVVIHHMRVRANLTADEHRAILAFLQNGF